MSSSPRAFTYILPIKADSSQAAGELGDYVRWIAARGEVIVVDGSAPAIFDAHARAWGAEVRHVAPAAELATPMGKVGGVLTGVRAEQFRLQPAKPL